MGLFGVAAFIYAALSGWALYLAVNVPAPHRDPKLVARLVVGLVATCVVGTALTWFGWRLARRADMSDPDDPRKPMMRF